MKRNKPADIEDARTVFDKPIDIQKQDEDSELWGTVQHLHAEVNKAGGTENFAARADQFHARLQFKVKYFPGIEQIRDAPTLFRILYNGEQYQVIDYDDYRERHRIVRIVGERYD